MAEGQAITLGPGDEWRHVGGAPETAPVEVVLRSFDRAVLFATGTDLLRPDGDPVVVPAGGGARLKGLHFFVRAGPGEGPARILVRGP